MYTAQGRIDQEQLFEQHYPLVRRQALALRVKLPAGVDLDDLIQAGTVGLLDAMQRFDATAGASFATFAGRRIHGAMIDELRSRDWLPRSVRRRGREIDATIQRLEQRLGRPPEEREIAADMDIDLDVYQQILADTNNGFLLPYEVMVAEKGEPEASPSDAASPFHALAHDQKREHLTAAIDALPEREKLLLGLYYQEDLNLREIGMVLGVSESRVCQLHSQAVARLRAQLAVD